MEARVSWNPGFLGGLGTLEGLKNLGGPGTPGGLLTFGSPGTLGDPEIPEGLGILGA
jgi:hypothetical protein